MDDDKIVELFWQRAESAIRETEKKYTRYIKYIAYRILGNHEDAEECENDVYLKTWNSIPPNRPNVLPAFLAKITRNLALDRYDKLKAKNGAQARSTWCWRNCRIVFRALTLYRILQMGLHYRKLFQNSCIHCPNRLVMFLCAGIGI